MKSKKQQIVLSPKEAARTDTSYERMMNRLHYTGKPTYRFEVGDEVRVGYLPNCRVEEVFDDGAYYGIEYGSNHEHYIYRDWLSVRPVAKKLESVVANDSLLSKLKYYNSTIYSLLSKKYDFGVNFDPVYQRGYVWAAADREKLLDSIFAGRSIGGFIFREMPFDETLTNGGFLYEIVDGKQRLSTICDFYENRFPYRGYFFNDLPAKDQYFFTDFTVSFADLSENISTKEVLQIFLVLNESGRPCESSVMDRAKELLAEEIAKEKQV